MADFYKQVPKTLNENLAYRVALLRRADKDVGFQQALMTACRADVLYFLGAFCWLFEPRPRKVNGRKLPFQIPFIPWPHQEEPIRTLREHLGFSDLGVEKSRGEGLSWISAMLALHDWIFEDLAKIGLVSRTMDAADNPEDPDSLFWKIDWEVSKLPTWMVGAKEIDWKRNLDGHTLTNLRNGSRISAYSATANVGRGGRYKWFLMDELGSFPRGPDKRAVASTQHATNSRLYVSTPEGSEGAYYEVMHEPSSMIRIIIDWKDNPTRAKGLYRFEKSKPVAVDPVNNPLPPEYNPPTPEILDLFSRLRRKGFKLEGRQRSPWYDHECDRGGATPQNIARELDRDYGGSMYRIFGEEFLEKAKASTRGPLIRGVLGYNPDTLEPSFDKTPDGPVQLWTTLNLENKPPAHRYVIGCDISAGLGGSYTSNSVIQVIDLATMEQVLEYSTNTSPPEEFAETAVAMSKWFYDAYLAWESNYGGGFTKRVRDLKYSNVYYRKEILKRGRDSKKEPGWFTSKQSKDAMFSEINRLIKTGELTVHSDVLVKEFGQYVRDGDSIVHVLSATTEDDSSKGLAHGDRVIALGVALMAARDRPTGSEVLNTVLRDSPPANTMAARAKEWDDRQVDKTDGWDDRTNDDLADGRLHPRQIAEID